MVQPAPEGHLGNRTYDKSRAKSLIYQTNSLPPDFVKQKHYEHTIPFATCEDTDEEKYPSTFVLRKKASGCPTKIGANRDFDPEVYRKQIREYQVSKVEAPRKAYMGAGNILCHPDGTRFPTAAPPMSTTSLGQSAHCMDDASHSACEADACSEALDATRTHVSQGHE